LTPGGPDRCPRCGRSFTCGAAGPTPCACTTLSLSRALAQRLRGQYSGCLCLACLRELAAAEARASPTRS
jgi:ribosomal protein L34E